MLKTVAYGLALYELFVGTAELVNQNATSTFAAPFASLPSVGSWVPGINGGLSDLAIGGGLLYLAMNVL